MGKVIVIGAMIAAAVVGVLWYVRRTARTIAPTLPAPVASGTPAVALPAVGVGTTGQLTGQLGTKAVARDLRLSDLKAPQVAPAKPPNVAQPLPQLGGTPINTLFGTVMVKTPVISPANILAAAKPLSTTPAPASSPTMGSFIKAGTSSPAPTVTVAKFAPATATVANVGPRIMTAAPAKPLSSITPAVPAKMAPALPLVKIGFGR